MADSSVAITAGTGTPIRVLTGLGAGSADQQVMTLADSGGNLLGTSGAPFPVSQISAPDVTATGTITAPDAVVAAPSGTGTLLTGTPTAGSTVTVTCPGGDSAWEIQLTGTFGGGTVYFEASFDGGTNWINVNGRQTGVVNTVLGYSTTTAGLFRGNTSGTTQIRARMVGGAAPSVAATIRVSDGVGAVFLNASIPAGTNYMGQVRLTDGTNNPAVKPGSTGAATGDPSLVVAVHPSSPLPSGTNQLGSVNIGAYVVNNFTRVSTASTNAVSVKTQGGNLQEMTISNPTATAAYIKIYDKATAPTVGTDVPIATWRVAATGTAGDTLEIAFGANGKRFSNGLGLAITAAAAATDATAAVAGVQVNGTYV